MSIVRIDSDTTHVPAARPVAADVEAMFRRSITYDPSTGELTWSVKRPRSSSKPGDKIGSLNSWGYLRFSVAGREYMVHRVCWFLHYGRWPELQIDHINGIKTDNRIANLRDVSQHLNMQNLRPGRAKTASGLLGAHRAGSRSNKPWAASIKVNGKSVWLGGFDSAADAHRAYMKAKATMHPGGVMASSGVPVRREGER